MSINEYIDKKRELYDLIIQFIEEEREIEYIYQSLTTYIDEQQICQNRDELSELLQIIVKINKNHHRSPDFLTKVRKVLNYLSELLKQTFSNPELFQFVKNDKYLLLFFIKKGLITLDDSILSDFYFESAKTNGYYFHFFYPELKSSLESSQQDLFTKYMLSKDPSFFDTFEEKREVGENRYLNHHNKKYLRR